MRSPLCVLLAIFLGFSTVSAGTDSHEGILERRHPPTATTLRLTGPTEGKHGQTAQLRIELTAEPGNPLAPINLLGPGTVALAVPESVDVDYDHLAMRIQAYGATAWEPFDWRAREGLISKGLVAVVRWALTHGLAAVAPDAGALAGLADKAAGVLQDHYGPVEPIFRDQNRYDVVRVAWDWAVYRWHVGSYRGEGQAKVEVTIPLRFTEDLPPDRPLALFLAYETRPRTEGGLSYTQTTAQSWKDLLGALGSRASTCPADHTQLAKEVQALLTAKEYEKALGVTIEAVEKAPDAPSVHAMKTRVLAKWGKTAEAIKEYQRFVALTNGHCPDLLRTIGLGALKDHDIALRLRAVWALGVLGQADDLPILREALRDSESGVRAAAVSALAYRRDQGALSALKGALSDSSFLVRKNAAIALGRLGNPQVLPQLVSALKDEEKYVRKAAALGLGWLEDRRAISALRAALADSYYGVKMAALAALARFGDDDALIQLKAMESPNGWRDRRWRHEVIGLLGFSRDKSAEPVLVAALSDPSWQVRLEAVVALDNLLDRGTNESLPALVAAMKDESTLVRRHAAPVLAKFGGRTVLPHLSIGLSDKDSSVRAITLILLGRLEDREAVPQIQAFLLDPDDEVKATAIFVLWNLTK